MQTPQQIMATLAAVIDELAGSIAASTQINITSRLRKNGLRGLRFCPVSVIL
jgi:hypothetical protein